MIFRFSHYAYCLSFFIFVIFLTGCTATKKTHNTPTKPKQYNTVQPKQNTSTSTTNTNTDGILWYAKQQIGVPYKYGSADPKKGGFDCSGFLFYVYTHFNIKVPRTSYDYMNFGKTISKQDTQKGDVLVFTGFDASQKAGGHVGIVVENKNNDISFIHASTSKGVIISKLSEAYYAKRFIKAVRFIP
mgnify:CR=1 FL=1